MNTDYKLLHWLNTDYIKLVSNPYADILTNEEQRSNAYLSTLSTLDGSDTLVKLVS